MIAFTFSLGQHNFGFIDSVLGNFGFINPRNHAARSIGSACARKANNGGLCHIHQITLVTLCQSRHLKQVSQDFLQQWNPS